MPGVKDDILSSAARRARFIRAEPEAPATPSSPPSQPAIYVVDREPQRPEPPVVNVDMRSVGAEIAAALRDSRQEAGARVARWDFKVKRDLDGLIDSIQATPVYSKD